MPATLLIESGDFLAEVERLRLLVLASGSNAYVPPNSAQLAAFLSLADALRANDETLAVSLADGLDYEVVRFTDSVSGRRFLGTRERLVGGVPTRGWGSYFLQPAFSRDALVEVPHPRFDLHTEELGARSFRDSGARGFLMAGAHRHANGTGTADVAHLAESIFQQVHASWIGSGGRTDTWQVHGYAASGHSFPEGTDAVLSNGDGSVSAEVLALDSAITSRGHLSYAYNTLAAGSAANLAVNDGLAGSGFSSLGGTTNVQGQLSRLRGGRFIHAEFEQSLRFTAPERQQAAAALSDAIQATSSFQVSGKRLSGLLAGSTLVPFGSTWRYKADGSNQGTAWRSFDFDASAWASGAGQLGYGDGDEVTVVPSGPSGAYYITTYFRRDFDLADPSGVAQLDLSALRDDGLVVYLNGTEVLRNNIAANPSFTTLATSAIAGADESTPVQASLSVASLPAGLLRTGRNVLAAEIHQSGATSSDISFDLKLAASSRSFQLDIDLDAPVSAASLQAADLRVNGLSSALAAALVDADTVRFTLPQLAAGTHSLELPAGSLEAADGTALGQWSESITIAAAPQYSVWQTPRLQLGNAPLKGYAGSGTDQVEVLWQTKPAGSGTQDRFTVDVRLAGTAAWSPGGTIQQLAQPVDGRIVFSSRLGSLQYATDYEYRVQHWSGDVLLGEYSSPFRTRLAAGDATPFSFVAYGDSGDPSTINQFRAVQNRINALDQTTPMAFAMLLGDNTYSTGTHAQLDSRFVPSLAPEATAWNARRIDYAAFGNHDIMTDNGAPTEASFSSPIPVASVTSVASAPAGERPEHTYSFDHGDVHIATFDSNSYNDPVRLNAQLTWLEADMQASNARWKIAVQHHPVAGSPDKPESPADNYYQQVVSRLRGANVDLLLAGHTHTYHQSFPLLGQSGGVATFVNDTDGVYDKGAGLVQVAIGTGGTALRSGLFSDKPYIRAGFSTSTTPAVMPGFGRIEVTPDSLVLSYIAADDGAVLSSFTIRDSSDTSLQTSTFQQGSSGYSGAVDTQLSQSSPATGYATAVSLNVDGDDPTGTGQDVQSLLRFDNLFGSGAGQVPHDATLVSARLRLSVSNAGNPLALYRLLQPWSDSATWTSLVGGVSTDGVEATATADVTTAAVALGNLDINVLSSLQAWQGGAANQGWLLQPTGADGVDFASSEAASGRPQLEVKWRAAVNLPPSAVSLANATSSLVENTALASDLKVADLVVSDDGRGTNTISLSGADAALFKVQGLELFLKAGTTLNFEQKAILAVTVQVADAGLPGSTPVSTAYTLAITNAQEGPASVGAITAQGGAALQEGVTLVAGSLGSDLDGISSPVTLAWLRNGVATDQTGSTTKVGPQGAGSWQTRHTYTDGAGLLTTVLSAPVSVAAIENGPAASLGAISASGPLRVGVILQAGAAGDDPDGDAADPQTGWQWLRNGTPIAGATASSYTTTAADLGASLAVVVSSTDAQTFRSSRTSAAVGPIQDGTPPAVSGITVEGRQVRVSFNEAIQSTTPLLANLRVLVGGTSRTISSLSVNTTNRQLLLNLSTAETAPLSHEVVRVEYDDPAGEQTSGAIQDLVGNDLASFGRDADTLRSASSVSALASPYTTLVLTGSSALSGIGNAANNLIVGNSGANSLDGGIGNDDIQGGAGNDTVVGGPGHDILRGGTGLDRLTGNEGNDRFDFSASTDGLIGGSRDVPQFERIVDLQIDQPSGGDTIDTIAGSPRGVAVLAGQPTALTRTAITTLLNGSTGGVRNLTAGGASVFTFGSGSGLRTFLAVDNGTLGYDSSRDQLLEISGVLGNLSALVLV
ncbi:MAG: metallophosphoesterase [Synechococcaceae cyanobacterium]|nr:metallophosphoesterase [Synechococcaceae cyanobacterium]